METQLERDQLLTRIQRLTDEADQKEKQYKRVEDQAAEFQKELEAEQGKIKNLHNVINAAKKLETDREEHIKNVEGQAEEFQNQVDELNKDKQHLENQLTYEQGERAREARALGVLQTRYDKLNNETQGIRDLLTATQGDNARLEQHNGELKATITDLQHVEAEIVEEKKISQGLRAQWERLKDELPRFDPSPKLAIAPPAPGPNGQPLGQSKTLQSLANELEGFASGTNSNHESGAESPVKVSSSDSSESSSSSDDDDDNETAVAEVEVKEVIREVEVSGPPQTIRIYVPFQTSAHNPIICWLLVYANLFILFRKWLSQVVGRAAPWLRRTAIQAACGHDGSAPNGATNGASGPASVNGPALNGTVNGSPVPTTATEPASGPQPDSLANVSNSPAPQTPLDPRFNRIAELIEPVVPGHDDRATYPPGEGPPRATHVPRHWFGTNIEPINNPPVFSTLLAFAFHLIFYYALYVCYRNYCEREIWLEANEAARRLVVDILALRARDGRGLASHFFSEEIVSRFDRFVLATLSIVFKVETQPWKIPG
ncbi:hypothetical protein N431DRAFT_353021 [Stipitochalara longipes BDJ]|nr:hypothetical protein N431DRAFT_353021 [Stipitochalara longipes BDJ]